MKLEKLQACCSSFLSSPYILVSELKKKFKIKYLKLFYWKSYLCWCICLSLVGFNFCFLKTWIIVTRTSELWQNRIIIRHPLSSLSVDLILENKSEVYIVWCEPELHKDLGYSYEIYVLVHVSMHCLRSCCHMI